MTAVTLPIYLPTSQGQGAGMQNVSTLKMRPCAQIGRRRARNTRGKNREFAVFSTSESRTVVQAKHLQTSILVLSFNLTLFISPNRKFVNAVYLC